MVRFATDSLGFEFCDGLLEGGNGIFESVDAGEEVFADDFVANWCIAGDI